jgi:hypothetical protein
MEVFVGLRRDGSWSGVPQVSRRLSQKVGLALGAQAGEARLRKVFEDAGFTHFRRAAQTPMNLILEARA